MPRDYPLAFDGKYINLLPQTIITAALTNNVALGKGGAAGTGGLAGGKHLFVQAKFVYGSGGTTVKAWVQTSLDKGVFWFDIVNFAFTTANLNKVAAVNGLLAAIHATPTDAALADNTVNNGLLGDRIRVKLTTTGVYAGNTTLQIDAWVK